MMRKALIAIISVLMLLIVSCSEYNIYREEISICRVGDTYFDTLQAAVDYIGSSRAISEDRTVYLLKDVLRNDYDDSIRKGVTVPATFRGDLRIDFSGHRYDFSSKEQYFFRFLGGDCIEVVNGTSVIFADSISTESALIVGTRTVTIDEHLIRDLRGTKKAVEVTKDGTLLINAADNAKAGFSGIVTITEGGCLYLKGGTYSITGITETGNADMKIHSGEVSFPHVIEDRINQAIAAVPDEEKGEVITNTTHGPNFILHEAVAADCYHTGHPAYYECSICHKLFKDIGLTQETNLEELTIPALTHELIEHPETESTCSTPGHIRYWECSLCGDWFSDAEATIKIEDKNSVYKPLAGHDWSDTLSHDDYQHYYECKVCGTRKDAADHTFSEWSYVSAGEAVRHCTVDGCGYTQNTTDGNWSEVIGTPATCGKDGVVHHFVVTGPNYTLYFSADKSAIITSTVIPATGDHDWDMETWKHDSLVHFHECKVCGERKDVADHAYTVHKHDEHHHWMECVCGLQGQKSEHSYTWTADVTKKTATGTCSCGYSITAPLTEYEPFAPTCTESGSYGYWYNTEYGLRFSHDGTKEIKEGEDIRPATGHDASGDWENDDTHHWKKCKKCNVQILYAEHTYRYVETPAHSGNYEGTCECRHKVTVQNHAWKHYNAKAATCTEDGWLEHWKCEIQGHNEYSLNEEHDPIVTWSSVVISKINHAHKVHHERVEETCTKDGNIEYWYCPDCKKYFSDESCTTEITQAETVLHKHTQTRVEAVAATCTADGNIEYWICSCGKLYSDEACTNEITLAKTVIKALGHDHSGPWVITDANHHWKVCAREGCDVILDKAEHFYEITYDFNASQRKLTMTSVCECGRNLSSSTTSDTGAFDISTVFGAISVTRLSDSSWSLSADSSKVKYCSWSGEDGVTLLTGPEPFSVSCEIQGSGKYKIFCHVQDRFGKEIDIYFVEFTKYR